MSTLTANRKKRLIRTSPESKTPHKMPEKKYYSMDSGQDLSMQIREAFAVYAGTEKELGEDWKFASRKLSRKHT